MYTVEGFADVLHGKHGDGDDEDFKGSWLEWFLRETERSHGEWFQRGSYSRLKLTQNPPHSQSATL